MVQSSKIVMIQCYVLICFPDNIVLNMKLMQSVMQEALNTLTWNCQQAFLFIASGKVHRAINRILIIINECQYISPAVSPPHGKNIDYKFEQIKIVFLPDSSKSHSFRFVILEAAKASSLRIWNARL